MVNAARAGTRGERQKGTGNAGVAGFPARRRFPANDDVFFFPSGSGIGGQSGICRKWIHQSDKYLASTELRTELKQADHCLGKNNLFLLF